MTRWREREAHATTTTTHKRDPSTGGQSNSHVDPKRLVAIESKIDPEAPAPLASFGEDVGDASSARPTSSSSSSSSTSRSSTLRDGGSPSEASVKVAASTPRRGASASRSDGGPRASGDLDTWSATSTEESLSSSEAARYSSSDDNDAWWIDGAGGSSNTSVSSMLSGVCVPESTPRAGRFVGVDGGVSGRSPPTAVASSAASMIVVLLGGIWTAVPGLRGSSSTSLGVGASSSSIAGLLGGGRAGGSSAASVDDDEDDRSSALAAPPPRGEVFLGNATSRASKRAPSARSGGPTVGSSAPPSVAATSTGRGVSGLSKGHSPGASSSSAARSSRGVVVLSSSSRTAAGGVPSGRSGHSRLASYSSIGRSAASGGTPSSWRWWSWSSATTPRPAGDVVDLGRSRRRRERIGPPAFADEEEALPPGVASAVGCSAARGAGVCSEKTSSRNASSP
mmetsp:Transcript_4616/g.18791  ORF Transcript_4616/g.18791 Transcript_4616/m.18791 type:complete len:452 (+) Transcript_4616:1577-2932(+)